MQQIEYNDVYLKVDSKPNPDRPVEIPGYLLPDDLKALRERITELESDLRKLKSEFRSLLIQRLSR